MFANSRLAEGEERRGGSHLDANVAPDRGAVLCVAVPHGRVDLSRRNPAGATMGQISDFLIAQDERGWDGLVR